MKTVLVLLLVGLAASQPEGTRHDNFDAQELVDNVGLLKNYANCHLGKGLCTADASDLMKTIADAIRTSCQKCSPKQRHLIRALLKGFMGKLPELWKELAAKEDPNGQFNKQQIHQGF